MHVHQCACVYVCMCGFWYVYMCLSIYVSFFLSGSKHLSTDDCWINLIHSHIESPMCKHKYEAVRSHVNMWATWEKWLQSNCQNVCLHRQLHNCELRQAKVMREKESSWDPHHPTYVTWLKGYMDGVFITGRLPHPDVSELKPLWLWRRTKRQWLACDTRVKNFSCCSLTGHRWSVSLQACDFENFDWACQQEDETDVMDSTNFNETNLSWHFERVLVNDSQPSPFQGRAL